MTREPLERLLETVSDEDLEALRDAILREEGRRRSQYRLIVKEPHPPLVPGEDAREDALTRWGKLLAWLAQDAKIPPAEGKRGVSIRLTYAGDRPDDPAAIGILLQEALAEAGLLISRMPEWMDATATEVKHGAEDAIQIELWDRPVYTPEWE